MRRDRSDWELEGDWCAQLVRMCKSFGLKTMLRLSDISDNTPFSPEQV